MSCALNPKCMPEFCYLVRLLHPAVPPSTDQWDDVRKHPTNSERQIAKRAQHSRYDRTDCATCRVLELVSLHFEEEYLFISSTATRTSIARYSWMNVSLPFMMWKVIWGPPERQESIRTSPLHRLQPWVHKLSFGNARWKGHAPCIF